mmetsp:Transcript_33665/g.62042  ORF Transcript_33665/g.62042 Transcript_33665/m.62042 type:complete len:531 (+) Transcript_33665:138-1730(+)|eukprot:CAMPEP_0196135706 /NCGR_PEP_ID=MMETSP0910-20130528/4257_1 /TAXON_ID=49265 /ORGANISM="Thalassiosira rotula, Strain GSO102" /LENGTH=530 /DNA_ID=CAMNT_0041395891 /DNA_START=112 /DNA_END=1704 /DNA_ORIENTATION=-
MRVRKANLLVAIATSCLYSATSFAPPKIINSIATPPRIASKDKGNVYCPPLSAAGPPVISNWRYDTSKGIISGIVTNHPTIPDGDRITTSPVKNPNGLNENFVCQTMSGSKYKLANIAFGAKVPAVESKAKLAADNKAKAAEKKRLAEEKKAAAAAKKAAVAAKKASVALPKKAAPAKAAPKAKSSPASASPAPQITRAALVKLAKSTFSLTGTTVGPNGKYLLAGKPTQSSGRAAKIWTAYLADPNSPDIPAGFADGDASAVQQLTIKLSPDFERLRLENDNYNKVQSGLFSGRFVKKMDYIQNISSSNRALDGKVSALAIESGQYDLKALLAARKGAPLRGRALRDAAASAGQCIQAVHSSNLVWTDLKTENFVVVRNSDNFNKEVMDNKGSLGLPGVKGIDLESVIVKGGNPIDYSPEACPPEFAVAFMGGYGEDFILDYSYDIWSLGMMLYELSTGVPYFEKKSPSVVTKLLCDEAFAADVSAVPDAKLRDLIGNCLSLDPRKRPDITGFLLHPYFITTGFGPFSF